MYAIRSYYGLPFILLIAAMAWMGRQTLKSQSGIFNFGRSKARQYGQEHPDVTFGDVAGAEEAKGELSEVVEFLRNPQKYHDIGARIPRGVFVITSYSIHYTKLYDLLPAPGRSRAATLLCRLHLHHR